MVDPHHEVILLTLPGSEPVNALATLRKRFPACTIKYVNVVPPSGGRIDVEAQIPLELWRDVTILVTIFTLPPDLATAPKLRYVHLGMTGVNHIISTPVYKTPSIHLTTASGSASPNIAEWVIMTALTSSWDYSHLLHKQEEKRWLRTASSGRDAHNVQNMVGQRVGILGYGSIGRQIGRLAKAFGMKVFAYTATPKETTESRRDTGYIVPGTGDREGEVPEKWFSGTDQESLHNFLSQDLDWLVLCVPSTTKTASLLGTSEFDVLTRTGRRPFLTNIARGTAIDQQALVKALQEGRLRGAALDVQDPEPLPVEHPLWDAPNVIIHPHISAGGVTETYMERVFDILSLNIERERRGEPLLNAVNRSAGY